MNDLVIAILCIILGAILGYCIGHDVMLDRATKDTIEQGYAEYNSTTGDWQWKSKDDVCNGN